MTDKGQTPEEREAELRAWALAQIGDMPDWSQEHWEWINAGLGYRVARPRRKRKPKPEPNE